jgi:hypothetical protein
VRAIYTQRTEKRLILVDLNLQLEQLRVLWRVVHQQGWIGQQQLVYVIGRIDEVGRMVGGWLRQSPQPSGQENRP